MDTETRICENCKASFLIAPEERAFYESISTPMPIACPECRTQQRLAFWPFGKFNKRTCDLSGERIISLYRADAPFPVYKNTEWYSDKWQAPALVYDPNRPFFDQLCELQTKTPRCHQFGTQNTACDWCDDVWESKNCHLCRSLLNCENVLYGYRTIRCRDSSDLCYCYDAEQSYDCTYCFKIFNVRHAFDTRDSMEGTFLYDCRNVRNCFMCWNLRNREYCIKNVQYSKEDYHAELKKYRLSSREEFTSAQREFEARLRDDAIHRADFNVKCKDSTGNYLTECKQCRDCNFLEESENCAYMFRGFKDKDGRDGAGVLRGEITYNLNQVTDVYHLFHSNYCTNCRNSEYLDFCFECEDCFGCVGLRNQRFCILNKRYDEQAYHSLIAEIKKAMMADGSYGKFFPYRMACGGYNLSLAGVFFPKTEAEVKALQGLWEESGESGAEGRSVYEPPDDIAAVDDAAVGKALICTETKRAFSVTAEELAFLRKHGIPLPREYPDVRTLHRVQRLFCIVPNPTTCFSCKKNITSFYPPAWGYKKIYCNECYLKAVL